MVAHGLAEGPVGVSKQKIGLVSAIFEDFVWQTWRLCHAIGKNNTDRVLQWVTWIIDMVAYLQSKDDDIGTVVLHETPDELEFEPRSKSKGNLGQVLAF